MPLELNETLAGDQLLASSAIVKLLQHYNQDLENVAIRDEVSTSEALNVRLNEVLNDQDHNKHLIVLNVHAINKGFEGGTIHYVGLIVNRELDGQYKAQYIDPMGHKMNDEVFGAITTTLGVIHENIQQYRGRLQYADIEDIEVVGNNSDCGPMLTYLMTKAAHNKSLSSSSSTGLKESLNIGQALRKVFQGDNKIKSIIYPQLHTLSSARLGKPVDTSRKQGISSSSTETLNDTSTSEEPRAPETRLDSLARLITGGDTCAAIAFDGGNVLVSNNRNHNSDLIRDTFRFLSDVASSNYTLEQISGDNTLHQQMLDLTMQSTMKFKERLKKKFPPLKANYIEKSAQDFEIRIKRDVEKITNSLAIDSTQDKRFSESIKDALKRPNSFIFVNGEPNGKHAEMAILDRLINNQGDLRTSDPDVNSGRKPLYIGISKLCCLNCHNAIKAFNNVSKIKALNNVSKSTKIIEISHEDIKTRGTHLKAYTNWEYPDFVKLNQAVMDEFCSLSRVKTSSDPQKETAPDSSSSPETYSITEKPKKSIATNAVLSINNERAAAATASSKQPNIGAMKKRLSSASDSYHKSNDEDRAGNLSPPSTPPNSSKNKRQRNQRK